MKKELEDYLWNNIFYVGEMSEYHRFPRDVIEDMLKIGMINNSKQAWHTLRKWERKGKYGYGCCIDLGWKKK